MNAVVEARSYLEALTIANHRGPTDTWTAARDRTARDVGIESTYAARIWNRWQSMKDVSGEAYRALQRAYEAQCEHNEKMAALHRQRREALAHGEDHTIGRAEVLGMDPLPARSAQATAQAVSRAG